MMIQMYVQSFYYVF